MVIIASVFLLYLTGKTVCVIILENVFLCLDEGDTMINEEHVKELYQAAKYDRNKQQEYQQIRRYYRSDYINKEILKSFFSGTFAYIILIVIWGIMNWEELIDNINQIDYLSIGMDIGILYGLFMAAYLMITWIIYGVRYSKEKKEYQKYGEILKKIHRMYVREDKLKM